MKVALQDRIVFGIEDLQELGRADDVEEQGANLPALTCDGPADIQRLMTHRIVPIANAQEDNSKAWPNETRHDEGDPASLDRVERIGARHDQRINLGKRKTRQIGIRHAEDGGQH